MFLSETSIDLCMIIHYCCYCLQVFNTEEILKGHIKDCFKINSKQRIKMPRKGEYVKFKILKEK